MDRNRYFSNIYSQSIPNHISSSSSSSSSSSPSMDYILSHVLMNTFQRCSQLRLMAWESDVENPIGFPKENSSTFMVDVPKIDVR
jgi:hypothetical protein